MPRSSTGLASVAIPERAGSIMRKLNEATMFRDWMGANEGNVQGSGQRGFILLKSEFYRDNKASKSVEQIVQ